MENSTDQPPRGSPFFVTSLFFTMQYLEDLNDLLNLTIIEINESSNQDRPRKSKYCTTPMSLEDSKILKFWQILKIRHIFHFFDYFRFFGFYHRHFWQIYFHKIHFIKNTEQGYLASVGRCPPAGRYQVTGTTRRELASAMPIDLSANSQSVTCTLWRHRYF